MFYDLNKDIPGNRVDRFTLSGVPYEIGPISKKYEKMILSIDTKGDVINAWRPVIEGLLKEWNDTTPEMSEANVGAIIPLITKRIYENRPQVQI